MWGPGLAALVCFAIFKKHKRLTTFKGTNFYYGLAVFSVLPIILAIQNQDYKYLGIGVLGFISILGEELGWRGFLQDALKFDSDIKKAIFIGIAWELWHFTNRTTNRTLFSAIFMVSMWSIVTTVFSFIMIKLTNRTRSLFIAVSLHFALNAVFEFDRGWLTILFCIPFWALFYWKWPKEQDSIEHIDAKSIDI